MSVEHLLGGFVELLLGDGRKDASNDSPQDEKSGDDCSDDEDDLDDVHVVPFLGMKKPPLWAACIWCY